MSDVIAFVARHKEAVLFLYVFVDQIGIPVPAVPALLAMGAFAAAGKLDFGLMLALSVVASVLAGIVGVGAPRFVAYGVGAAVLWASAWSALGYQRRRS